MVNRDCNCTSINHISVTVKHCTDVTDRASITYTGAGPMKRGMSSFRCYAPMSLLSHVSTRRHIRR